MATHKGEAFLREQLDSILVQLGPTDELVISDDGSTDGTLARLEAITDPRFRLLRYTGAPSAVRNFEHALTHARGAFIFLADQDDVWMPRKVERMLAALETADLVVSDCRFIDERGRTIGESYYSSRNSGPGLWKNLAINSFLGNCMAFRREVLARSLPFPAQLHTASRLKIYHDVWIGLVASRWYRVVFIPDKLSEYRRHGRNASPTGVVGESTNSLLTKLYGRGLMILALVIRQFRPA